MRHAPMFCTERRALLMDLRQAGVSYGRITVLVNQLPGVTVTVEQVKTCRNTIITTAKAAAERAAEHAEEQAEQALAVTQATPSPALTRVVYRAPAKPDRVLPMTPPGRRGWGEGYRMLRGQG